MEGLDCLQCGATAAAEMASKFAISTRRAILSGEMLYGPYGPD